MSDMKTEMRSFVAISDIISLLNMSSGFLSIISSINNNLGLAAILMLVAIMFDSVDGWVARKTNRLTIRHRFFRSCTCNIYLQLH